MNAAAKELGLPAKYIKQWTKEDRSHLKGSGKLSRAEESLRQGKGRDFGEVDIG
jgi:hypothetical protein